MTPWGINWAPERPRPIRINDTRVYKPILSGKFMRKAELKAKLLEIVSKKADKCTIKQLRYLIAQYA